MPVHHSKLILDKMFFIKFLFIHIPLYCCIPPHSSMESPLVLSDTLRDSIQTFTIKHGEITCRNYNLEHELSMQCYPETVFKKCIIQ